MLMRLLVALAAALAAGAVQAQSPGRSDPDPPTGSIRGPSGAPPSAEPTDRGGGPGGPAIKRSQERGETSGRDTPRRGEDY